MPYRLLKHGKEHLGVINLDFELDGIKHIAGLQMGTRVKKCKPKQKLTEHLEWLGYEVWRFNNFY